VDSKGLTGAFFVRVAFKGLSKLMIDSKEVICRELGHLTALLVRVRSKGPSEFAIDSKSFTGRESGQIGGFAVRVESKGVSGEGPSRLRVNRRGSNRVYTKKNSTK
jgi:hypothetical protein